MQIVFIRTTENRRQ